MDRTLYDDMGGAAPLRALVDRFYDLMDELPEAAGIRAMHRDMARARERLFLFLSGWSGGPDLYVQAHGHPRLRARHAPFRIGASERDQWMLCMRRALAETGWSRELQAELALAFEQVADFMRNADRPAPPADPSEA